MGDFGFRLIIRRAAAQLATGLLVALPSNLHAQAVVPAPPSASQHTLLRQAGEPDPRAFPTGVRTNSGPLAADIVSPAWVRHYASELIPSRDSPAAMTTDEAGNIYVTGTSNEDYLTVKYDASGTELWRARYNGPSSYSYDHAGAIAVDSAGNVVVTGISFPNRSGYPFQCATTIKYSASGHEEWVARYNPPWGGDAGAGTIAVDPWGSVYVGGASDGGPGTNWDCTTLKYSADGTQLWEARYNGPAGESDEATAIAVTPTGDVYVTGRSNEDCITIRYDSSGTERWVARYNGPANAEDRGRAIALDAAGRPTVVGWSTGVGTSSDYVTISYDTSGHQQWLARYDGPGHLADRAHALALDRDGSVYVTGESTGAGPGTDYATIKYDSSGSEQWVARYLNPPGYSGLARAIVVDTVGNVSVAGESSYADTLSVRHGDIATVAYSEAGAEQWVSRHSGLGGTALAVGAQGSLTVIATGGSSPFSTDYTTISYGADGTERWVATYDGPRISDDQATAAVIGPSGGIIVTGESSDDYLTVSYDATGVELWSARYNDAGDAYDRASAVATDSSENIIVTGYNNDYYVTVKYSPAGTQQWVAHFATQLKDNKYPPVMAVDPAGTVHVAGQSDRNCATITYSDAGVEQWVARYGTQQLVIPTAITLDDSGNTYVLCFVKYSNYLTIKYNPAGAEQWVASYNGPANSLDEPAAIAVNASGDVYVTGASMGSGTGTDYATIKYNPAGVEQWVARYNHPLNFPDEARAIAVDPAGNVYVTGYSSGECATVKYRSDGSEVWVDRYREAGSTSCEGFAIALDQANGGIVVGAHTIGPDTTSDFCTLKYTSAGTLEWVATYRGPERAEDEASGMVVDGFGSVFMTGSSHTTTGWMYTIVKYDQLPVAVQDQTVPTSFWLDQNYPNPFNPTTTIEYTLPRATYVTLRVYNALGEEAARLVDGSHAAGTFTATWDASGMPSGVYFYRLSSGEHVQSRKMLLMR